MVSPPAGQRRTPLAVLLVAHALLAPATAQLATYLTPANIQGITSLAQAKIQKGSAEELYFSVKILKALGKGAEGACFRAQKLLTDQPTDLQTVAFAGGALKEEGCNIDIENKVAGRASETLKSHAESESFMARYLAILGSLSLDFGATDIEPLMKRLTKFRDENGFYKEHQDDKKGDSQRTFLMLELVALSAGKMGASKGIKQTLEKAYNLLPGVATEFESTVDASLISAVVKANPEPLTFTDSQLLTTAQRLLTLSSSPAAFTLYKVVGGIQAIAGFANAPLAILVSKPIVKPGEAIQIEVVSLLGQAMPGASVSIERLTLPSRNEEKESYRGRSLQSSGGSTFEVASNLEAGVYSVSLMVDIGGGRHVSIKRSLVVKTSSKIANVKMAVSPTRRVEEGKVHQLDQQNRLPGGLTAASSEGDHVHVTFELRPAFTPHQAFIRFTHLDTNLDTFFVAQAASDGTFSSVISLAEEVATFLYRAGDYQISLLVGDVALEHPLEFAVGRLRLDFPAKLKPQYPLYTRPLLYDSDNALGPMPEIQHQFRPPAARPPAVVSTVFIGLVAAPLMLFIAGLPMIGANLKAFPNGLGAVWSVGLFASILAFLLLFFAYWVSLRMFTTIRYMIPLSLITFVCGRGALRAHVKETTAAVSSKAT